MSKKDSLMKEIDEISERVRFWHNAILALLTAIAGMMFGVSQDKIIVNISIWFFGIMSISILIFGLYRLDKLNHTRRQLIKKLEKES